MGKIIQASEEQLAVVKMIQEGSKMVRYVTENDIEKCIDMMEEVKDDFAGYKEQEFLQALRKAIRGKEAFLSEKENCTAGLVFFSFTDKEILFLAVHPDYRKLGIAKELLMKVKSCFKAGDEISVTTFRKDDVKGTAARACYAACGFTEAEELVVFNYPCQRLVCKV